MSDFLQALDYVIPVVDETQIDLLIQVVSDVCFRVGGGRQSVLEAVRIDQRLVPGLAFPCPGRVVRPRPVVFQVVIITPGVEVLLPTWWRNVQGFPRFQIDPGRQDVDVDTATGFVVPDRRPGIPIRLKAGPGQTLEIVQDVIYFFSGWLVLRRPGNHRGRVPMLEVQGVGNGANEFWVAAQHFNAGSFPTLVIFFIFQVVCGGAAR